MGLTPYDLNTRRTARVPNLAMDNNSVAAGVDKVQTNSLDMLTKPSYLDMGAACFKSTPTQYRQAGKSASMRQKYRRTSFKRYTKVKGVEQIDDSLLDDFYNSQTKCILSKISDWSFDVLALEKASNGKALFHVIFKLFQHHNLINHFKLDIVKLMTFATLVEEGYRNNPYHNATHAADVAQAMHCYISQGKIAKHMTPLEILIAIVSAITHDLDHPGVSQKFLVSTNNHLANLYENESVLEKHHWRMAIAVLHQSALFSHLPELVRTKIEVEMKSLILATDMGKQKMFFDTLKRRMEENSLDMAVYDDRHFILQIALKCADISNPCREWSVCKTWSERVCNEFFNQGDLERNLQMTISPLCDRYTDRVPKIQTGFIDFCVKPLFTEFEKYLFPSSILSEQLTHLHSNFQRWSMIQSGATAVRPSNLNIPLNIDTIPCDIPSPTVSEDIPSPTVSEDIPSPTDSISCDCSYNEESDVVALLTRRHSLPVLSLEKKRLLSRRPSLPDGPQTNFSKTKHSGLFDILAENLSHDSSVCSEQDKALLSQILDKLLTRNALR